MNDLERVAEIAFVTVFVARLATTERGPFAVLQSVQVWIQNLPGWANEIKAVWACPVCMSVWLSGIVTLLTGSSWEVWPASCALAWAVGNLGGWARQE